MLGPAAGGYWIAHGVFWILLVYTVVEHGLRRAVPFAGLWIIGYAGSMWLAQGASLFMSYVAILDIALVLLMFKGDVRLT